MPRPPSVLVDEFANAAPITGAAAACGSCSEPTIQVHTPLSQPQKPPVDELDALGVGIGVGGAVAAGLVEAEADGEAEALADLAAFALVVPVPLALGCGVAVAERDAEADGPGLLVLAGVPVLQTEVGNGNGEDALAALAGVARVSAPATAANATGVVTAIRARRWDPSVLRVLVGTALLRFRQLDRRVVRGFARAGFEFGELGLVRGGRGVVRLHRHRISVLV